MLQSRQWAVVTDRIDPNMPAFSLSRKGWAGVLATRGRRSSAVAMAIRRHSSARSSDVDPFLEGMRRASPSEASELSLSEGADPLGVREEMRRLPNAGEVLRFGTAPTQWACERSLLEGRERGCVGDDALGDDVWGRGGS